MAPSNKRRCTKGLILEPKLASEQINIKRFCGGGKSGTTASPSPGICRRTRAHIPTASPFYTYMRILKWFWGEGRSESLGIRHLSPQPELSSVTIRLLRLFTPITFELDANEFETRKLEAIRFATQHRKNIIQLIRSAICARKKHIRKLSRGAIAHGRWSNTTWPTLNKDELKCD